MVDIICFVLIIRNYHPLGAEFPPRKIITKMRNLNQYIATKDLIRKACNINMSIPKGYGTKSADYDFYYSQKQQLIFKIVEHIKKFQMPIKYGVIRDVIYFSFEGEQFSFHGNYGVTKSYNGKWQGTRRHNLNKTPSGKIPGKNDLCQ